MPRTDIKHLIYIPFTGLGRIDFRGQEWFRYRKDIFRDYSVKSLANQSEKNFTLWVSFRPEDKDNPVVLQIAEDITNAKLDFVFTFDGVMMFDDRGTHHNKDLEQRMEKSLNTLKDEIKDAKWVFQTDLGSDDMLEQDAVKEIQRENPRPKGATYYLNGYIFNTQTGQVADWNRKSACSKYTIIYPVETFLNAKKHLEYVKGLESHEFVPLIFDATRLSDKKYACTVHGANISTSWNNPERGKEYEGKDKNKIMKLFGL